MLLRRPPLLALALPLSTAISIAAPVLTSTPLADRVGAAPGGKAFLALDPETSGLNVPNLFNDPRMWGDRFREYTLGALETGLAAADFNQDGFLDLYVISKNGPNALYLQDPASPLTFKDVAATARVDVADDPAGKTGATAVDINQDGWPDIYVCRLDAPNLLFLNNGDGTFTEQAAAWGLAIHDASVHATFADYDGDGDLDLYLVTNILNFAQSPTGRPDRLLRNNGDQTFSDVSREAGIWGNTQGHTAIWFDANRDGWPDLYVANDFETPDRFYLNRGDGTFADVVDERLPHVTYFSMGADAGDLNNDGHLDFIVADMRDRTRAGFMTGMEEMGRGLWEMERVSELIPQYMWNAVYLGTGADHFEEAAHLTGMNATGWTWATRIADLDSDGRADVFYTNGMLRNFVDADLVDRQNVAPSLAARARVWRDAPVRAEPNLAYRNLGDLAFADVSKEWGLDLHGVSFGCAVVDLDGDGDLDIVFANLDAPPTVLRNDTTSGHRVAIQLVGRAPNLDAIGAELELVTASGTQLRQHYAERGVVSSELAPVVFGLGADNAIEHLTIRWPDGTVSTHADLPANHLLRIRQPDAVAGTNRPPARLHADLSGALYTERATARGLDYVSDAYPLEELARQRLLPRRLGLSAPALAAADVNGDGLHDVFVSGARGQAGALFLGQTDGGFARAPSQPWTEHAAADDLGAAFFDADGDGQLDLYVSAGGVEGDFGAPHFADRLYRGDGRGGFTFVPNATTSQHPTSIVAPADFNGDGRTDLFVGGGSVPGRWPHAVRSHLLRNTTEGLRSDYDKTWDPGIFDGRVTGATWADLNGDGTPDLIVAADWSPIRVALSRKGKLHDATEKLGLAGITGWWRAVAVADINGDGRPDILAGNVGLNTKYRATSSQPAVLYAGDLDGSGNFDLLEAQFDDDGRLYPVRGRSKLAYSFPRLTRDFRSFAAYAAASVEEIRPAELLNAAQRFEVTELRSGVFLQQTDGTFAFSPLPRAAQLAPINGFIHADLDGDGMADLFVAGNDFSPEPSTGRFDGSVGRLFRGDGQGQFTPVAPGDSGLVVPGDTRAILLLPPDAGSPHARILTATARGPVRLFERN